jgi:hypothetical protein
MKLSKRIVGAFWILVAVYWGINFSSFLNKLLAPDYPLEVDTRMIVTLSWDAIDFIMALICGSALLFNWHKVRRVVMFISTYFAVYFIIYLLFGGEEYRLIRIIIPFLLFMLCILTILILRRERNGKQGIKSS